MLRILFLVMIVGSAVGCRAENEVRWSTGDSVLIPHLTAAQDFLVAEGHPIWRDDSNPNTGIVIIEDYESIYPHDTDAYTEWHEPRCFMNFCDGERRNRIVVNPSLLDLNNGSKEVAFAHEFKHLFGFGHVDNCPDLMTDNPNCVLQSL